jgi:hypothetical protein
MVPWILFNVDREAKILYAELLIQKLIECQPSSLKEVDTFLADFYPVIDQIQAMCLENGLRQVCSTNLEGVQITHAKPHVFLKIAFGVYNHTKNCILLEGFNISNTHSPIVGAFIEAVRGFLPPFMRNLIKIKPNEKQNDEGGEKYDECSESFGAESDEII